jgi:DNA-binding CsgD family transcriptional regulator
MVPHGFRANARIRERLPDLWTRVLAEEAQTFAIVEDLEREYPANIEAFGFAVFVTDSFLEEFCASPRPYLAAVIYERLLDGRDDVLLTPKQLVTANSTSGINIAGLHVGMRTDDLANPRTAQAVMTLSASFYFVHGGYRINAMINEVYGAQQARFMEMGGYRLLRDFHQEAPESANGLPPQHHPYLYMQRREWVEQAAVHPHSQLFATPSPRIYFSATERRVLQYALLNAPGTEIADACGISRDSVKKTWLGIYHRVSRQAPYLIPAEHGDTSRSRGPEKRRHLLDYLRLEELRPAARPKA